MSIGELLSIALLAFAAWLWYDSLRARDAAVAAARRTCERDGVQLLDDTVSIRRLRLARDGDGHLRIARQYSFEYSQTGDERRRGSVLLLGDTVEAAYAGVHLVH